jgi:hypothetical protein
MILDLQEDAKVFESRLVEAVEAYARRGAKAPPISALEIGYEFAQAGWICIHFDTRETHDRDGEWTTFQERDLIKRPQWFQMVEAMACFSDDEDGGPRKAGTLILHDGPRRDGSTLTEEDFSAALGDMLKDVLLRARKDGLFAKLPRRPGAQIDIEEFNGTWAWPDYEDLGKTNVI